MSQIEATIDQWFKLKKKCKTQYCSFHSLMEYTVDCELQHSALNGYILTFKRKKEPTEQVKVPEELIQTLLISKDGLEFMDHLHNLKKEADLKKYSESIDQALKVLHVFLKPEEIQTVLKIAPSNQKAAVASILKDHFKW